MKHRNVFLALLFSVLTCGIYYIYWFVSLTNQSNQLAPKNATMGGVGAFFMTLITFGIYDAYWSYRMGEKAGEMLNKKSDGFLYLVLWFFTLGFVPVCLGQSAVNKAVTLKSAD